MSATVDRLDHPWRGLGLLGADVSEAVRFHLCPMAYPPLLEMNRLLLTVFRIGDHDVCFAAVVAHGKQCDTGIPAIAQRFGDRGQRISRAEHLAANQMRCDIAISEAEPVRLRAVRGEFFFRIPGFAGVPPSAFGVDTAAECVHTSVQIGADAQTVHPHVVPDVDDGRDAMWAFVFLEGFTTGDSERVLNTLKETGPADAANQYSHVHDNRA